MASALVDPVLAGKIVRNRSVALWLKGKRENLEETVIASVTKDGKGLTAICVKRIKHVMR